MSHTMVPLEDLVFNEEFYPRTGIDEQHIRQLMRAMEANISLPPIVVAKGTNIIVDGVHRYHSHLRQGREKIAATVKAYKSDAELWHDAVMYNTGVGLKLGQEDSLKVIEISERLGLKEVDIAGMLRTSIAYLRVLKPRYATVQGAVEGVKELRRVPLKGSVRHLAGHTISAEQADAKARAPGPSYLLSVNQVLDALNYDLLPPEENHPALWDSLRQLAKQILEKTGSGEKAA